MKKFRNTLLTVMTVMMTASCVEEMQNPDTEQFAEYILQVASGEILTANEKNLYREIAIFKSGVTL